MSSGSGRGDRDDGCTGQCWMAAQDGGTSCAPFVSRCAGCRPRCRAKPQIVRLGTTASCSPRPSVMNCFLKNASSSASSALWIVWITLWSTVARRELHRCKMWPNRGGVCARVPRYLLISRSDPQGGSGSTQLVHTAFGVFHRSSTALVAGLLHRVSTGSPQWFSQSYPQSCGESFRAVGGEDAAVPVRCGCGSSG